MSEEILITLIALPIVCGSLIALTAIITEHKRKSTRDDMEATLKMEMLQRGMTAEDIERVLAARMGSVRKQARSSGCDGADSRQHRARTWS